jgi:hypothetical protein
MIYEYSGYLCFRPSPDQKLRKAEELAGKFGLEIDPGANYIEFEYSGRDRNRKIVQLLFQMAEIIGDAEREIVCTIDREGADPVFEFYSIRHGKLHRQKGRIFRGY